MITRQQHTDNISFDKVFMLEVYMSVFSKRPRI